MNFVALEESTPLTEEQMYKMVNREKLICMLEDIDGESGFRLLGYHDVMRIADHLIDNGVTVQDEKPLEAFLHPIDAYDGLKAKYLVFKADTGTKVEDCFVLRPDKDPAAVEALRAYANATDNEALSEDIYNWVGKGVTVQEWIPVSEPPKETGHYLVNIHQDDGDGESADFVLDAWYEVNGLLFVPDTIGWTLMNEWHGLTEQMLPFITHWTKRPKPLKGE